MKYLLGLMLILAGCAPHKPHVVNAYGPVPGCWPNMHGTPPPCTEAESLREQRWELLQSLADNICSSRGYDNPHASLAGNVIVCGISVPPNKMPSAALDKSAVFCYGPYYKPKHLVKDARGIYEGGMPICVGAKIKLSAAEQVIILRLEREAGE